MIYLVARDGGRPHSSVGSGAGDGGTLSTDAGDADGWADCFTADGRMTVGGEFDFSGRFISIRRGFHQPKPIQRPFPPIMNAGGSPVGRRFAAEHADIAFTYLSSDDVEVAARQVSGLRDLAREAFGREIQVWIMAYVVCRPTAREARDYLRHYAEERGDWESARHKAPAGECLTI